MGCGIQYRRFILFTVNIVFWLCGAAMLRVGLALLDDYTWQLLDIFDKGMDDPLLRYSLYLLIGIGAFIMVVGFLGCTGVWKSNTTLLQLYTLLVGVVLFAEIVAGTLAVVFVSQINQTVGDGIKTVVNEEYSRGNQETLTSAIDATQHGLACCGSTGYQDYRNSFYANTTSEPVPETCCKMGNNTEVENRTLCLEDANDSSMVESKYLNLKGCYPAMKDYFSDDIYILAGVLFGIAAIQIMDLILGCCLIRSLNAGNER